MVRGSKEVELHRGEATSRGSLIEYIFSVDGFRVEARETVTPPADLEQGDRIDVSYQLNRPVKSALELPARRLSDEEVEAHEASQRALEETGQRAKGKIVSHYRGAPDWPVEGVRYEFEDGQGRRWRGMRWVKSLRSYPLETDVKVRYLIDQPEVNTLEETTAQ